MFIVIFSRYDRINIYAGHDRSLLFVECLDVVGVGAPRLLIFSNMNISSQIKNDKDFIMISVGELIELVKEVESNDPIDLSGSGVDQASLETSRRLIALGVLEMFRNTPEEDRQWTMLSAMTKLVLENFVLNLKLKHK